MDDLKFVKKAYEDPRSKDEDFIEYKNKSQENTDLVNDMIEFDDLLTEALDISVDETLKDKIMLNVENEIEKEEQTKKDKNVIWFKPVMGLAASFLIVFTLTFTSFQNTQTNIGEFTLSSVYDHIDYLNRDSTVSLDTLNNKVKDLGISFNSNIGKITVAKNCDFYGKKGIHVVLGNGANAVTLFYYENTNKKPQSFSDDRFNVDTLNYNNGNYILIAENMERLKYVKKHLTI